MERYLSDARTSLRILRRSPGLSLSAVAALAMGIGFTTIMFSIVRGGTRDLPFADAHELVALKKTAPLRGGVDVDPTPFDFLEWSRQQQRFEGLGAFQMSSMNLAGDARRPDRRPGVRVTPNTFALLGQTPVLGRVLAPDDAAPGAPAVVLLSHDVWQSRFEGDSGVLGRVVRVDGQPHTVIGVMPPRFGFPVRSALWLPLAIDPLARPGARTERVDVFGRLRDGVSREEARTELVTIASRLARAYPQSHEGLSARVLPFVELEMEANTPVVLYLMLGVVSFTLLIASANVANLLLARAAGRTREIAVRTALGARRARIVAHHVSESLVLAVLGGAAGLAIAQVGVRFFAISTANILDAFWIEFRVDAAVVLFATVLVAIAGVLAGILPGLRASSANVAEILKNASGGSTGLRIGRLARGLVVGEVALATGLLVMTMTFTRSALALHAVEWPFPAREVLTGQIGLLQETLGSGPARGRVAADLVARLRAIPEVRAAALASVLPGRGAGSNIFTLDAPPVAATTTPTTTGLALVTPGFFDVLGARLLRGREFRWEEGPDAPAVAVVNESWVRRYSPDRDPLGRRLWFGQQALEVVGVVPDLQMQDPEDRAGDGVYASLLQLRPYVVRVMLRTVGDPLALTRRVHDAVETVDADVPLLEVATLRDAIYADKKILEALGALFGMFGVGALFLTMVGLYGVVSFAIRQRTREIGVRVALGAAPRNVVALVLRQGAVLVGIGTVVGLFLAFALSQAMAAATEFVEPAGVVMYLAIAGALAATALAGLLRPVLRALALQPMTALRFD
jgi:predicted permease